MKPLPRDAKIFVAGHRGLVGSAVWRQLEDEGFTHLFGRTSSQLDLRDELATEDFFKSTRPDVVVMAAARVGGILANSARPTEFLTENLRIQLNVLGAAHRHGVERLLFLGSSCIYPKFARQPISESSLLTGPLEPTNDAYAIAKIAGVIQVQALRRQHGRHYISAMPTNLYGPEDNFDLESSHVLPGLLRRYHEAARQGRAKVVNWGTGGPLREFLHVDDLARACLFLLESYDAPEPINVGSGNEVSIRGLAEMVAEIVGFRGKTEWDRSHPDGTPRKLLDSSRINALGWRPAIPLLEGIASTYEWYLRHHQD